MIKFKKIFSENLKKYRRDNNLSQEIAAENMGISTVFLSELECCKKMPSSEMLINLYRHMGYDYIPINPGSEDVTYKELLSIISKNPEISDTLLSVAKNLISK